MRGSLALGIGAWLLAALLAVTFGASRPAFGAWVLLYGKNGYEASEDLPGDLKAALAKIKPGSLLVLDSKVDRQAEAVFNQSVRKKGQVLRDGTKRLFRIQDEKPSS